MLSCFGSATVAVSPSAEDAVHSWALQEYTDKYVLHPTRDAHADLLVVHKHAGLVTTLPMARAHELKQGRLTSSEECFGFLGMFDLITGPYLVLIMDRQHVGKIRSHDVWKVARVALLPCTASGPSQVTPEQLRTEQAQLRTLTAMLNEDGLYFSYTYDLSLSLQQQHAKGIPGDSAGQGLWERAQPRFVFNYPMMRHHMGGTLGAYKLPVIYGSVSQNVQGIVAGRRVTVTLIARRNCRRLGPRLLCRGADADGHVANFVETEQVVEVDDSVVSVVLVRGSVPLFWTQQQTVWRRTPPITVGDASPADQAQALEAHMQRLARDYASVCCVDLLSRTHPHTHGREGYLARIFEDYTSGCAAKAAAAAAAAAVKAGAGAGGGKGPELTYVGFDFNHEMTALNHEKLAHLFQQLEERRVRFGSFAMREGQAPTRKQSGVFRVNCKDCLDRTNVVQMGIARLSLESQLRASGLLNQHTSLADYPGFLQEFTSAWVWHGDQAALQYAGTRAMKRDLTLTGHRTAGGMIRDGMTAMQRYYLALAKDAERQAGFDLLSRGGYGRAKEAASTVLGVTRGEGLLQQQAPAPTSAKVGGGGGGGGGSGGAKEDARSALQSPVAAAGSRPTSGVGAGVSGGSVAATTAPALPKKKPLPPLPQAPLSQDPPATPEAPPPLPRLQSSNPSSPPPPPSQPASPEARPERDDATASISEDDGAGSGGKQQPLSLEEAEEREAALRAAADRAMAAADELTQEVAAKLDDEGAPAGD